MADLQQAMEILTAYKTSDGDMAALNAAYNTLTATGKTPLGLNQWQRSDKPMMEDFNEDNRIVDEKLREIMEWKVSGRWRYYYSLDEVMGGIPSESITYNQLIEAMQNSSTIVFDNINYSNLHCEGLIGTVTITRCHGMRVRLDFLDHYGEHVFVAGYNQAVGGFSGWKMIS